MEKIKVRCIEEFIDIMPNLYNIKVYRVLNGGWSNFSTYQCITCGEIFINKNNFEQFYLFQEVIKCPNCKSLLNDNIVKYPEKLLVGNKILSSNIDFNYISNIDNSKIEEFYLLP